MTGPQRAPATIVLLPRSIDPGKPAVDFEPDRFRPLVRDDRDALGQPAQGVHALPRDLAIAGNAQHAKSWRSR